MEDDNMIYTLHLIGFLMGMFSVDIARYLLFRKSWKNEYLCNTILMTTAVVAFWIAINIKPMGC